MSAAKLLSGAALTLVLGLAGPAGAAKLVRHPYLQKVTPTSAVVVWTTDAAEASLVRYGTDPVSLTLEASGGSGTQHEVELSGLEPGKRYYYSVGTPKAALTGGDRDHYFETSPEPGTKKKFRAWLVGDSGTGQVDQRNVRDAMLAHVGLYRPDLFLHVGDMAYTSGTAEQFTKGFFTPYRQVLRNTVVWPALGNHEGMSSDSTTQKGPYYDAYVLPSAAEAGGLPSGTEAYYSFDYANVHFIVLDSHDSPRGPNGAMLTWMKSDLAATDQDWVVAFWHHPPYTKGTHDSDVEKQLIEMRENALPILEAGGVDLVLTGHSHIYERSFLVDGAYATPTVAGKHILDPGDGRPLGDGPYAKRAGSHPHDGAVYVVAGHGGAGLGGKANHPLMFKSELAHGSCVLDLQDNRFSLVNIRADGKVSDRFTLVKGTGLVVAAPDGGELFSESESLEIRWATVGDVPKVSLAFSPDDGATWNPIASDVPNTGSFAWKAPGLDTARGLVRVSSASDPLVSDESNAGFRLLSTAPSEAIAFGEAWRYSDGAADPGAGWTALSFDDGAWKEGPAELGYGDGDEATLIEATSPSRPSAYFRKVVSLGAEVVAARLEVRHDDGVAVWVNGKRVASKYVDDTAHGAFAAQKSGENEVSTFDLPAHAFSPGDNVVAAMVKQAGPNSSDLSFDLKLEIALASLPPPSASTASAGAGSGTGSGAGGSGGASGSGAGPAAGSGADAPGSLPGEDAAGCGCRASPGGAAPLGLLGAGLLACARLRGRRRVGSFRRMSRGSSRSMSR